MPYRQNFMLLYILGYYSCVAKKSIYIYDEMFHIHRFIIATLWKKLYRHPLYSPKIGRNVFKFMPKVYKNFSCSAF